ncbi:MAG: carboxypeptidase-like regulatory domain-containing protein [Bacteroidetes bacterium]|nr:carboxypeptidase-like regulatory domain-containing protein [Bacteroidota bacterium]
MKNIYICFLTMLLWSSWSETSAYTVTGLVLDSISKQPIKAALVTIENTKIYTHSNNDGIFNFNDIDAKEVDLKIVCFGYHSESIHLKLPYQERLVIELCPDEVHLDGYTLQAKHDDAGPSKIELKLPEIDRLRGQNFGDMIKNIAGVATINSGPGISKPVIRGLTGSRIVTVYNDIRQEVNMVQMLLQALLKYLH